MKSLTTKQLAIVRALINGPMGSVQLALRLRMQPETLAQIAKGLIDGGLVAIFDDGCQYRLTTVGVDWVNQNASVWLRRVA